MKKTKTAPGAGNAQDGIWKSSCANSTTLSREAQVVAPLLQRGEENAIPTRQLLAITGIRDARHLRAQIRRERQAGALILSTVRGRGGYFLPADGEQGRQEIQQYTSTLRARALNTLAVLRAARRALRELEGQMTIDRGNAHE